MNKSTKKVIAREFLFLFSSIVFVLLVYGICLYPYNWYQQSKIEDVEIKVIDNHLTASQIRRDLNPKLLEQIWIFDEVSSNYDLSNSAYETREKLWEAYTTSVNEGTIVSKWHSQWKIDGQQDFYLGLGFATPESWEAFIIDNTFTKEDSVKTDRLMEIEKEINELEKRKSEINQNKLTQTEGSLILYWAFLSVFGVLFFLRYLFYVLKWSIHQLKS